jgi:hypothetical protein
MAASDNATTQKAIVKNSAAIGIVKSSILTGPTTRTRNRRSLSNHQCQVTARSTTRCRVFSQHMQ